MPFVTKLVLHTQSLYKHAISFLQHLVFHSVVIVVWRVTGRIIMSAVIGVDERTGILAPFLFLTGLERTEHGQECSVKMLWLWVPLGVIWTRSGFF